METKQKRVDFSKFHVLCNSKREFGESLSLLPKCVLSVECVYRFCLDGDDSASELAALEQQNGHLPQIEVDEVTRLVGHIRSEVSADDAVPCWVVLFVELLLDVCGNVLRMCK